MSTRTASLTGLGIGLLAYVWLAIEAGTAWPWSQVVHEDGRRTLAETVFYGRHFLREVPVAIFYVLALTIAAGRVPSSLRFSIRRMPIVLAAILVLAGWTWVVQQHGVAVAIADLGQFHVRDDEGGRGAHWGGHYLSNLVVFGAAWVLASSWRPPGGSRAPAIVLLAVGVGTLVFVGSPAEAVASARAAAHQAREIATHLAITLPMGFWALGVPSLKMPSRLTPTTVVAGGVSVTLVIVALWGGALEQRPAPWSARIAAHLLEHTPDVVLVICLCAGFRRRSR